MYLKIYKIGVWIFNISMPLILGFVIRFLIDPLIKYFHNVDRRVVCIGIYILIMSVFLGGLYLIVPNIIKQCIELYSDYDVSKIESYINPFFKPIYDFMESIKVFDFLLKLLNGLTASIFYWSGNVLIAFGLSFYLVYDDVSVCRLIDKTNFKYKEKIIKLFQGLKEITYAFLQATVLDFIIFYVICAITFKIIGLDFVWYIALFLAITNLIPIIGPYFGGIPVVIYAFFSSITLGYISVLAVIVLQIIESSFIQPLLFKKCIKISPIVLIVALGVFGDLFGIMGMILTPLLLAYYNIIKNICFNIENK